ncbi:MAG TPA: DUF2934 domain-containing protein [Gallionellaceae bacterium]|nr:DUF2934 domain-containing protein [Gallionellaceae bacterium]
MATNRTSVSAKPTSKKTASTAKTTASTAKTTPKPRTSTATTKTAKPKQTGLTPGATEASQPRATRKAPARKSVTPEERYQMIARAAYFLAERHGFSAGRALDDWIAAEKEIDGMLKSAR